MPLNPQVAEYVAASQASLEKAASDLATSDAKVTALTAEKQAGEALIQQTIDALVSGGRISDTAQHRKAAAAKLATYAGAMDLLAKVAVHEPNTKAASIGTPVPGPNSAPAATPRSGMSPNPQAGLDKLAARVGANVG